jgi:NADPH:quinone reductase-like Zn-dependent oxidoreductase
MWKYTFDPTPNLGSLKKIDVAAPPVGPDQVLVKIKAVSLNRADLLVLGGARIPGRAVAPGRAPLTDAAGEVVEVGAQVTKWRVGDRVMPTLLGSWVAGDVSADALGGVPQDGVLAEAVVASDRALVRIPDALSDVEASTLPGAALTAWNALFDRHFPVRPGDTVLVLGTGGVAVFAVQFAVLAGATVVVTSSSDAKRELARGYGAAHTVPSGTGPGWSAEVRRITGGRGVDHVVETVGAPTLEESFRSVKVGGVVHWIGTLGGPGTVDPEVFRQTRGFLRSVSLGSREQFEAMTRAVAASGLRPVVARNFALDEVAQAYAFLRDQGPVGKVVVRID